MYSIPNLAVWQGVRMSESPNTTEHNQYDRNFHANKPIELNSTIGERINANKHEVLEAVAGLNIIMLGIPGAGKTTLANNLKSLNPNINYISVGEISRNLPVHSEQRKYLNELFDAGSPVGIPEFFLGMIEPYVDECIARGQGFILDGIPKKYEEIEPLIQFMRNKNTPIDMVLACEVDPMSAYERISERGPRHNDNDSMEVFANRTKIYLDNVSYFKEDLQGEGAQLISIDTTKLNENECVEHFIAAAQLTSRKESEYNVPTIAERLPQVLEALRTNDTLAIAVILAPFFDDKLTNVEDYSAILCAAPESARVYLEQKFLNNDPFLAHTPFFLEKTVQNYLDTTLNSILHIGQSLLDEVMAMGIDVSSDAGVIENLIKEQISTRELLRSLQESMVDNRNFNSIINEELELNKSDVIHTSLYLEEVADKYGVDRRLLSPDAIMKAQPELWSMLTSRKLLRAIDTNYRRTANGVPDSHHSLLPYNSTPRAMLANSVSSYMPFIEAVSSSEYKYTSTFGFVHLIGMDDNGESYSVEYPLMMYDRRLTDVGSDILDKTLDQIDSIYSNHDLWHNMLPVYADHFILHHPDAPISYGGRREDYLRFGKLMRTQKEEYEIGVAMAHAKTQQEQFKMDPSLKSAQVDIVRTVIANSSALYEDLMSRNVPIDEAIDMVDFTVFKAMTRLYNILPPSDEVYEELDISLRQLDLPKVKVDVTDVGNVLLQQALLDKGALANALNVPKSLLQDLMTNRLVAAEVLRHSRADSAEREPDAEFIYAALCDMGLMSLMDTEESFIELDGMDKVRWIALNAPQRPQLKGHMEKVHGKSGRYRYGTDAILPDVRDLIVLQQAALSGDMPHYLYRKSARKANQRLSYQAYSVLFDDNQDFMVAARNELHELIDSTDVLIQTLGSKIAMEVDSIIDSLSSAQYFYGSDRIREVREIAMYLKASGWVALADALEDLALKYEDLSMNETQYQVSVNNSYAEAARRITEEQMTII